MNKNRASPNILHISTQDGRLGAARSAHRIHTAQLKSGMASKMLVLDKSSGDPFVTTAKPSSLSTRLKQRLHYRLANFTTRNWSSSDKSLHTFGQLGTDLVDQINTSPADVVNLHWIAYMLSTADIGRLRKPIVWTMHDMWAFCGGEHYTSDAASARFIQGYQLDNRPASESGPDLNRKAWLKKLAAWQNQNIRVVCPSTWLANCAKQSKLFANAQVDVIGYPMEMQTLWRPAPKDMARAVLGLPPTGNIILSGAVGGLEDPRKGGDLLKNTLARIASQKTIDLTLVVYGQAKPLNQNWPCPVIWLGEVKDDRILGLAYAAADLMIVPSRQDNLPNTAIEAQACGTPVIAFETGGLPDIVEHKETGWLAKPFDVVDLAQGIIWSLEDSARLKQLCNQSRQRALKQYDPVNIAAKYSAVYHRVLGR